MQMNTMDERKKKERKKAEEKKKRKKKEGKKKEEGQRASSNCSSHSRVPLPDQFAYCSSPQDAGFV